MQKITIENWIPFFPIARCNDFINFCFCKLQIESLGWSKQRKKGSTLK
jgi:hypothetical protein